MRERTEGRGLATRAIHAGERPDPTTHAHRTPIYATATFTFDTAAEKEEAVDRSLAWEPGAYFYSRTGNPTNRALEEKLASLEGAEDAVVSSSGMAAVAATLFAHLTSGDHLVAGRRAVRDHQRPARRGLPAARDRRHPGGPDRRWPPSRRRSRRARARCSSRRSTNPRLRIPDLDALAAIARRHGLLFIADNTFLGPVLLRPARARRRPRPARRHEVPVRSRRRRVGRRRRSQGPDRPDPQADRHARPGGQPVLQLPRPAWRPDAPAPVAGGLGQRGPDRRASSRATPKVEWVRYPGLASHPDHAVARRLLGDLGGRDGDVQAGRRARRRWPPSPTTCVCATSASASATSTRWSIRDPRTAGSSASRSAARTSRTCSRTSSWACRFVA